MFSASFQSEMAYSTWGERFEKSIRQNLTRQVFDTMPHTQLHQLPPRNDVTGYPPHSYMPTFGLSPPPRPPDEPPTPPYSYNPPFSENKHHFPPQHNFISQPNTHTNYVQLHQYNQQLPSFTPHTTTYEPQIQHFYTSSLGQTQSPPPQHPYSYHPNAQSYFQHSLIYNQDEQSYSPSSLAHFENHDSYPPYCGTAYAEPLHLSSETIQNNYPPPQKDLNLHPYPHYDPPQPYYDQPDNNIYLPQFLPSDIPDSPTCHGVDCELIAPQPIMHEVIEVSSPQLSNSEVHVEQFEEQQQTLQLQLTEQKQIDEERWNRYDGLTHTINQLIEQLLKASKVQFSDEIPEQELTICGHLTPQILEEEGQTRGKLSDKEEKSMITYKPRSNNFGESFIRSGSELFENDYKIGDEIADKLTLENSNFFEIICEALPMDVDVESGKAQTLSCFPKEKTPNEEESKGKVEEQHKLGSNNDTVADWRLDLKRILDEPGQVSPYKKPNQGVLFINEIVKTGRDDCQIRNEHMQISINRNRYHRIDSFSDDKSSQNLPGYQALLKSVLSACGRPEQLELALEIATANVFIVVAMQCSIRGDPPSDEKNMVGTDNGFVVESKEVKNDNAKSVKQGLSHSELILSVVKKATRQELIDKKLSDLEEHVLRPYSVKLKGPPKQISFEIYPAATCKFWKEVIKFKKAYDSETNVWLTKRKRRLPTYKRWFVGLSFRKPSCGVLGRKSKQQGRVLTESVLQTESCIMYSLYRLLKFHLHLEGKVDFQAVGNVMNLVPGKIQRK